MLYNMFFMNKKFIYLLLTVLAIMGSCKPSAHEMALAEIEKTKQFIANNQDSIALEIIDSIHIKYRTDVDVRRLADTLRWDIEYRHAVTTLPQVDSALALLQERMPQLTKPFRFIKTMNISRWARSNTTNYAPKTTLGVATSNLRWTNKANSLSHRTILAKRPTTPWCASRWTRCR